MSNTKSFLPELRIFEAIGRPIAPIPINPTRISFSLRTLVIMTKVYQPKSVNKIQLRSTAQKLN